MAEYYALLARAVGALPRNDEASRREIYVKARSALIRQLKAITPPLPPAEISKQRLALEEAIRRVGREAADAAAANGMSEEEISRQAEQALERALAPGGDEGADRPSEFGGDALRQPSPQPQQRQAPTFNPDAEKPQQQPPSFDRGTEQPRPAAAYEPYPQPGESRDGPPARQPQPAEQSFQPRPGQSNEQPRSAPSFEPQPAAADVITPPPGRREPPSQEDGYAEVVGPRSAERIGPRAPGWERAETVTDIEEPSVPRPQLPLARGDSGKINKADAKRGGRGWERRGRANGRRSFLGLVAGVVLFVIVVGTGGYFLWDYYGDDLTEFFGGEVVNEGEEVVAAVGEGGEPAEPGAGAELEEPPVFMETIGYLYSEPTDGGAISDRYEASLDWSLLTEDGATSVISAAINIPDQGLSIVILIEDSADPQYSHQISALVTQAARFQDDPIAVIDNIAVKTSEEGIGAAFAGDILTAQDMFLLALPSDNSILNTNRIMQSPWFDLAITYESGRRAIVSFNKGTAGDEVFASANEAWQ
ncbi:MAG: hypothetical protein ACTSWI_05450 [Alphaproteobacteria bacterium]